jgi:tetratricopeptide (TPR) repeat protein
MVNKEKLIPEFCTKYRSEAKKAVCLRRSWSDFDPQAYYQYGEDQNHETSFKGRALQAVVDSWSKIQVTIGLIILVGFLSGCVGSPESSFSIFDTPEKKVVKEYLKEGQAYEEKGDLVNALRQYNLAMTVNPSEPKAAESRKRVEEALNRTAKIHYQKGLKLDKQGKYGLARHQFLIALRLRPDYPEATKILTSRKRYKINRYIVHKIHSGQTLSGIAKIYYGDHKNFPIIAKYNNITDVTQIRVGQKIKIPELEGFKFLEGQEHVKTEEEMIFEPGIWDWEETLLKTGLDGGGEKPKAQKVKSAEMDKVASYRDKGSKMFKEKKYREAIAEFRKVLKIYPEDEVALDYSYRSHFNMGKALFEKKDYLSARSEFEESLHYNYDCDACQDYIKKCENLYMEAHYKMGMQYYGKEQLVEAMREWELVQLMDPNYKKVDHLIKKAKTILKKLEEIRESERKVN